jgi:hypothetical protein
MATLSARDTSGIIELRQYTLHPGQRETLIALFDGQLVEPQERVGMRVLGQFRDLDVPDRFIWLRGYPDHPSRTSALETFYGGLVWAANRSAANATMIDSDDVLLLRPVDGDAGLMLPTERPPVHARGAGRGVVKATVWLLRDPIDDLFVRGFDREIAPVLVAAGAVPRTRLMTDYGKNGFPRHPVREGENAYVWITSFASREDGNRHEAELERSGAWKSRAERWLADRSKSPPQVLHLEPTARSLLRHEDAQQQRRAS